jgi:hypothetical protein
VTFLFELYTAFSQYKQDFSFKTVRRDSPPCSLLTMRKTGTSQPPSRCVWNNLHRILNGNCILLARGGSREYGSLSDPIRCYSYMPGVGNDCEGSINIHVIWIMLGCTRNRAEFNRSSRQALHVTRISLYNAIRKDGLVSRAISCIIVNHFCFRCLDTCVPLRGI